MCGRFALSTTTKDIEKLKPGFVPAVDFGPRYNIAPSQNIAVCLNNEKFEISMAKWGLIPFWTKDASIGNKMINARSETLLEKASFKNPFKKKRCLIFAEAFYEWKKIPGEKTKVPYLIKMKSGAPFTFGGLWDKWKSPDEPLTSTTIITTTPNKLMEEIHNRMPVIIPEDKREMWLTPDDKFLSEIQNLLVPYSDDEMEAFPVSTKVNSPANDFPEIMERA
jgi:putative SOS response-associated peptidase YedK